MTPELPEPPLPPDADLSKLHAFMLDTERLLGSELLALSTGDEFKAAVLLWCRAWKQIPACSLPDDDRVLASFAGVPVRKWMKLRQMALRGFVKCSDGRLWHFVLAKDGSRALDEQERYREGREADRERLRAWREAKRSKRAGETGEKRVSETKVKRGRNGGGNGGETSKTVQDKTIEYSEPKGSAPLSAAGVVDLDLKATVFRQGLAFLRGETGRSEPALRGMLGRWCRDFGDPVVIDAISAAQRHKPNEPVAWIEARLKAKPPERPERKPIVGHPVGSPEYEAERKRIGFPDFSPAARNGAA